MPRVRHHTNDAGLKEIRRKPALVPGRGWGIIEIGVHVEVEPFGTTRPSRPGRAGPKDDLGSNHEGAFVEFDAPPAMVRYVCGRRNTAVIPVSSGQVFSLQGLNPEF